MWLIPFVRTLSQMPESNSPANPFKVFTPEDMSTQDVLELFVKVSDFNKVYEPGHTMLNGPRGSGKSMLFRYLMPDCQMAVSKSDVSELSFFAVLVSIKNTMPNLTELRRLENRMARTILSEHALTSFVASKVFKSICDTFPKEDHESWISPTRDLHEMVANSFQGISTDLKLKEMNGISTQSSLDILNLCRELCDQAYSSVNQYAKRISFPGASLGYSGDLCDFLSFLCPVLEKIRSLPYFPGKSPIYLLLDDADYLTLEQTRVLNSWLATRTQEHVSIKVSTQYSYKTLLTVGGQLVQAPHDYLEIDIADVYTSRQSSYSGNVREILNKRLTKASIDIDVSDFFPPNEHQERRIEQIAEELRRKWKQGEGRGHRPSDDAIRYARPNYIRELGGASKSRSTYTYAGFDQLVHISSGQVRYVLQSAATMFDEQKARTKGGPTQIDPTIQNDVFRREADSLMFNELEYLEKNAPEVQQNMEGEDVSEHQQRIVKLRNLISFLGSIFFDKLVSEDSERKVFSVAISGDASREVEEIFSLGAVYGYFHRSSIGKKDGTGRTRLYVLTRRLAPHFGLDPSSFAGYKFLTNACIRSAMAYPERTQRAIRSGKSFEDIQEELPLE